MLHKGGRRSWCSSISFTLGIWHWPQHLQEAQVGDIRLGIECSPCGQCLSGPASAGQRLSQHQAFCNSHSANPAVLHSMCMCRWPPSILSATGFRPGTSFRHHNIWTHVVHTWTLLCHCPGKCSSSSDHFLPVGPTFHQCGSYFHCRDTILCKKKMVFRVETLELYHPDKFSSNPGSIHT